MLCGRTNRRKDYSQWNLQIRRETMGILNRFWGMGDRNLLWKIITSSISIGPTGETVCNSHSLP